MTENHTRGEQAGERGPISDDAIVTVLRPFVRATRPVLRGLRESDPFGLRSRISPAAGADGPGSPAAAVVIEPEERSLSDKILDALASVQVPGTSAWAAMDILSLIHI